jgi:hypothetical protein
MLMMSNLTVVMTRGYVMSGKESTGSIAGHRNFLRRPLFVVAGLWLALAAGCADAPQVGVWEGPSVPAVVTVVPWDNGPSGARSFRTQHYQINTTMTDDNFLNQTAQVMEGALSEYRELDPAAKDSDVRMQCYLFSNRALWNAFTTQLTGPQSNIYLQINRGGYCYAGQYVAYDIGQSYTLSVAAHEGWHQFVFRNFVGRLPPFLEEGLATTFETIRWDHDLPQWNLSINGPRVLALRTAIERHSLWPLETLVTLDAGRVVAGSNEKIDAFYAQDWAFADFLYNGNNGARRTRLLQLISDAADGTIRDPNGNLRHSFTGYNITSGKPLLEDYLGENFTSIDNEFQDYMHQLAYEGIRAQYGD